MIKIVDFFRFVHWLRQKLSLDDGHGSHELVMDRLDLLQGLGTGLVRMPCRLPLLLAGPRYLVHRQHAHDCQK